MAPAIVVDNTGNVRIVTGGSGGSFIATSVAQVTFPCFHDYHINSFQKMRNKFQFDQNTDKVYAKADTF